MRRWCQLNKIRTSGQMNQFNRKSEMNQAKWKGQMNHQTRTKGGKQANDDSLIIDEKISSKQH